MNNRPGKWPRWEMTDPAITKGDVTIHGVLAQAALALESRSDTPRLDAEILLSFVLGKPRSHLHAWPREHLDEGQYDTFRGLVQRRQDGEPVAYLTGRQAFWSLDYRVTPHTLIPRPETEHLVELALRLIPEEAAWRIADLGTGTGAIALALAHERPRCQVVAVDVCARALEVAAWNARHLGIGNVGFRQSDWFAGLRGERFDLIAANPPYVRHDDPHLAALQYEPATALVSGPGGMEALEAIVSGARAHLTGAAWLVLEHGHDQGAATLDLLRRHGYHDVAGYRDYAGHDRNAVGRCPPQEEESVIS